MSPSPLTGEGWGEGEHRFSPSPPSPPARGGDVFLSFRDLEIVICLEFVIWILEF